MQIRTLSMGINVSQKGAFEKPRMKSELCQLIVYNGKLLDLSFRLWEEFLYFRKDNLKSLALTS